MFTDTHQTNGNGKGAGGTLRAALYYRVSSPGQVDAFGFDAQKRLLPEHCRKIGWTIAEEYPEPGVSGDSLVNRPAMQKLLADAERGRFDVILAIEDSRLSRGQLRDWEYLKSVCDENNVCLATPQGIFYRPGNEDDDFLTDIRGAMSKREKKRLLRQMARGRQEAAEQGLLPQRTAPHAYTFERYGRKGSEKRLVVDEEKAKTIQLIFQFAAYGIEGKPGGTVRIAQHLTDALKIPGPRGGRWEASTVKRIIKNPVYKGTWFWNRYADAVPRQEGAKPARSIWRERPAEEWTIIPVPAIVDEALWEAANQAMRHRDVHGRGRPAAKYLSGLFTSYIRCPHCSYTFRQHQGKWGSRRYVCLGRSSQTMLHLPERCHNQRWKADELEADLWEVLVRYIESEDMLIQAIESNQTDRLPEDTSAQLAAFERAIAENDAAFEKVRAAYRRGIYTLDELEQEFATLRREREDLDLHVGRLRRVVEARAEREQRVMGAIETCRLYRRIIRQADRETQRGIIEDLVTGITLDAEGNFQMLILDTPYFGRIVQQINRATLLEVASISGRLGAGLVLAGTERCAA